jgi:putative membrane protein
MSWLFAFLHHLAAFVLFGALFSQLMLTRDELSIASARRILVADMIFGVSSGVVLAIGFLRVFYFEKGPDYYFDNAAFEAKLGLFVLVGLASIYPTVTFLRWRPALKEGRVPAFDAAKRRTVRRVIHAELTGVVLILLCAALMARGIGQY